MSGNLSNNAVDIFNCFPTVLDSPANFAYVITPNNSANLAYFTRGIYFGSTGNVNLEFVKNDLNANVTFAVTAGTQFPWRVRKVWAANTTVTSIVGFQ